MLAVDFDTIVSIVVGCAIMGWVLAFATDTAQ